MPLEKPHAPEGATTAVLRFPRLRTSGEVLQSSSRVESVRNLTTENPSGDEGRDAQIVSYPHELFEIGARDILNGDSAEKAQAVGWRYFVAKGDKVVAADVRADRDGKEQVQEITDGPAVARAIDAIEGAGRIHAVVSGKYQLRALSSGGLNLLTLWLKDQEGKDDWFIPVEKTGALKAGHAYKWSELQNRVEQTVRTRLTVDDAEQVPSKVNQQPRAAVTAVPVVPSISNPQPVAAVAPADDLKSRAALYTAVGALVMLGVSAAFLALQVRTGLKDDEWTKYVYLLGILQAIGFSGAGWLWGKEVHREQAMNAEGRASTAAAAAVAAKSDAQKQQQKISDLADVIQAHANASSSDDETGGGVPSRASTRNLRILAEIAGRIRNS